MTTKPLHIMFSPSAVGSLRKALSATGRDEDVTAFFDQLEFGPIYSADLKTRAAWIDDNLGYSDWDALTDRLDAFWKSALDVSRPRTVWFSPRSASDYCGFLEWLRRNGDAPCQIVDLTDIWVPVHKDLDRPSLTPPLGAIRSEQFIEWRLFDLAAPLTARQRDAWLFLWQKLMDENTPLRVLDRERLVSAPIDRFDGQLLGYLTNSWQKATYVVGQFIADSTYQHRHDLDRPAQIRQTGDVFPFGRIRALIDAGAIEARGDERSMQSLMVRR